MPRRAFFVLGWCLAGAALPWRAIAAAPSDVLPLAPQSSALFQCGPTTLAAVLAYHGTVVPEGTISGVIYSPTARGVLLTDLAWYARSRGFNTHLATGTAEDLQAAIAGGRPPIVLLDLGLGAIRQPHFTAVIGWDERTVRCQGRRATGLSVAKKKFLRQWQRAGNQYLLVTPAS